VGPWFIKDALSTSGELRLFTWPDYSKPEVIEAFEKATDINVKLTNYSTNVASFVGENNRLKGRVQKAAGPLAGVKTASGILHCQNPKHLGEGHASHLFIRPEAITLANGNGNGTGENRIACRVENHHFEGPYANIFLRTAGDEVLTMRLNNDGHTIALDAGQPVTATFRPASAVAFDGGRGPMRELW
jgi:ABC-type Fe3+/spermidine/putrescine transport system ATPase subunit